jgi:hypothetical protein
MGFVNLILDLAVKIASGVANLICVVLLTVACAALHPRPLPMASRERAPPPSSCPR